MDGSLLAAAQSGHLTFQISHSEQLLVVVGKDLPMFFEIRTSPKISVEPCGGDLFQEAQSGWGTNVATGTMTCLCMPPTRRLRWTVVGHGSGELYGFLWHRHEETGRVVLATQKFC